jgi:hypothetical protein
MFLLNIPQPGDLVNEIYSEQIPSIVSMCLEAGDDPHLLLHEVQDELRVKLHTRWKRQTN